MNILEKAKKVNVKRIKNVGFYLTTIIIFILSTVFVNFIYDIFSSKYRLPTVAFIILLLAGIGVFF